MAKPKQKQEETASMELTTTKVNLPAELSADIEEYAAKNDYTQDFSAEDLITPRLRILQSGSKQVKKQRPEYVEGAEAGQIYNTATNALYDGTAGVVVVPCFFNKEFVEWTPVDAGGGLVKRWGDDDSFKPENNGAFREDKGRWKNDETGTEIVQVANYYVLVVDPKNGAAQPAIISLSSTEYKKSKGWASKITQQDYQKTDGSFITPPPFYKSYQITTVPENNESGDWFGFRVIQHKLTFELPNGKSIWEQGKRFRKLIQEGKVKVVGADEQEAAASGNTNDRM